MAISGDTVVIGATSGDTPAGVGAGSAYVYATSTVDYEVYMVASTIPINGGSLIYIITINNRGPGTAQDFLVTNNLPASTTFISCDADQGGVCRGGRGNNQRITFSSLAPDETATITLITQVDCNLSNGTLISNTASVVSDILDPNPRNNSATVETIVSNPPPTIICPADIDTFSHPGQNFATLNPGTPATSDAGGCPVTVRGVRSDNQPLSAPYPVGLTTITWQATDSGNQTVACRQSINVRPISRRGS